MNFLRRGLRRWFIVIMLFHKYSFGLLLLLFFLLFLLLLLLFLFWVMCRVSSSLNTTNTNFSILFNTPSLLEVGSGCSNTYTRRSASRIALGKKLEVQNAFPAHFLLLLYFSSYSKSSFISPLTGSGIAILQVRMSVLFLKLLQRRSSRVSVREVSASPVEWRPGWKRMRLTRKKVQKHGSERERKKFSKEKE